MNGCSNCQKVYTVEDYLFDCVNFAVPKSGVYSVCAGRKIEPSLPYGEQEQKILDLMKADLYVWICMGPSRISDTKDSDNGWSHSGGGYTLSPEDKELMLDCARKIYDEYEEESPLSDVEVSVSSFGIMPCDYDYAGFPLPHIV